MYKLNGIKTERMGEKEQNNRPIKHSKNNTNQQFLQEIQTKILEEKETQMKGKKMKYEKKSDFKGTNCKVFANSKRCAHSHKMNNNTKFFIVIRFCFLTLTLAWMFSLLHFTIEFFIQFSHHPIHHVNE